MHDHSPPSIGHWAMVRALLAILLFNALALGIFIASYLAYVRRPHPAAFFLCMVMPLLLLLLLAPAKPSATQAGADLGRHRLSSAAAFHVATALANSGGPITAGTGLQGLPAYDRTATG